MNKNFGKKPKTDFIVTKKENTLYASWNDQAIIQISYKDFMRFVKKVKKRHKQFSDKSHFCHLSPDVSFFMVKK